MKYHIEQGVNPNYQHPEILSSPLVIAIQEGHTEIALHLLDHQADPLVRSYYENLTGIEAALKYRNSKVISRIRAMPVFQSLNWWQKLRLSIFLTKIS